MRRINSEFRTVNMSEEGKQLANRDYFGYAEMDDFACYVMADSLDTEYSVNSARLAVESIIRDFTEAPSMGKRRLGHYIRRAHAELNRQKKGMHLKASVVVAVTDYRKIRYAHAGNSRFYLIRSARILERTQDQSLTQNLLETERISLDQVAAHEERNNLYSFLGERGKPKIQFSRKKKLENGDIFALLTRGIWEQCPDEEFLDIVNNAAEPQEIINQTEDYILKQQDTEEIDNYTLAVTFVNKVFQPPDKPWTIKRVLLVAVPVMVIAGGIGFGLYMRHRSIREKEISLENYMDSGEAYLRYDNYPKAAEEYGEAKKLADSLKRENEAAEADQYKRLAEEIILADEAMKAEEYQKAQKLYLAARELSMEAGNAGKEYIEDQLKRTEDYIEVFDLIAMGEQKEEYGNYEGAARAYKEAKEKAASIYYGDGKAEALERQMKAEEQMEKIEMEEAEKQKEREAEIAAEVARQQAESEASQELENQQKANDQENAIELENKGNELMAQGQYENAITFYQTAQAIYRRLELSVLADAIDGKIAAARAGINAAASAGEAAPGE
ncbi:PP2C family serine/threonine-protein phosphatase [uncultured Acetatifactor sp.]|uniref:PP2C family protein-serine/threonine phosphatase n=1 Tax=uncultured Acetatifactor sp. TaxID=1671927 RepID=UPI00260275C2|nr:hypothetical protein [uncultured Acetatifactor sp.]